MLPQTDATTFGVPPLMYKANDTQACTKIPIADDNLLEETEKFTVRVFPSPEQDYIMIDENLTDILIMDNDCKLEHKMV